MDTMHNTDRNEDSDFCTFFLEMFYFYGQLIANRICHFTRNFMEKSQVAELIEVLSDNLAEHPTLRYVIIATGLTCAVPIVMFIVFAIFSVIVTFAGFLFVEGTLLAIGGLFMFICLLSMIMVMSVLAMFLGIFYLVATKLGILLRNFESSSGVMRNLPWLNNYEVLEIPSSERDNHQD